MGYIERSAEIASARKSLSEMWNEMRLDSRQETLELLEIENPEEQALHGWDFLPTETKYKLLDSAINEESGMDDLPYVPADYDCEQDDYREGYL